MNIERVILGTGSYVTVQSGNKVSISGDGGLSACYVGASYKKLAPRLITYDSYHQKYQELLKLRKNTLEYNLFRQKIEDEYIQSYYETRLKNLDVYALLDTLFNRFGEDIILLCYESVEEFCHRRLLADYLELKTGIYLPEVSIDENGKVKKLVPIRYKKRLEEVMKNSSF